MTILDDDAQPVNKRCGAARLNDRKIDELIGLCKGMVADNKMDESEGKFLLEWMENNHEIVMQFPANVIYPRLASMLDDDVLDQDEQKELLDLVKQFTGNPENPTSATVTDNASLLPLCEPAPHISFEEKLFCLTGKFITGSRKKCEAVIKERGGTTGKIPTFNTNYLVIGLYGSAEWIHSTYGRKIEKAVGYRDAGKGIHIISEKHWAKFL